MQKVKLKLQDSEISLPSIQKLKPLVSSPKTNPNISQPSNTILSLSPNNREGPTPKSPNELIVTGLEDIIKQRSKVSKLNLHHKIATLIKEIEERDAYIRTLENEFHAVKKEPNNKKNSKSGLKSQRELQETSENDMFPQKELDELDREEEKLDSILQDPEKMSHRDQEIAKLRRTIEENQRTISKLSSDTKEVKRKIKDFNEVVEKSKKIQAEVEAVKSFCREEVKSAQNKLNDLEIELNSQDADMQELGELLKRSEEKRNYSQEYNTYMENNSAELKDKLSVLNSEKQKLELQLKNLQNELKEKRELSEDLKKKMEQAKAYLDYEKMKNSTLAYNYESIKESLRASNEKNEIQRLRHRTEKEKLQKKVEMQNLERKTKGKEQLKRKATMQEQNHLSEISKEESARWQQKYAELEKELQSTHEDIEKLSRTEIYLKNQLLTKDLMISQIEALIKMHDEPDNSPEPQDSVNLAHVQSRNIAELATMIEEIKYRYKKSDDKTKCLSCFRTPQECYLAIPCGHISCQNCKSEFENICPSCTTKTSGLVRALVIEHIINHLKKESDNIEKAKKILRDQSLS